MGICQKQMQGMVGHDDSTQKIDLIDCKPHNDLVQTVWNDQISEILQISLHFFLFLACLSRKYVRTCNYRSLISRIFLGFCVVLSHI